MNWKNILKYDSVKTRKGLIKDEMNMWKTNLKFAVERQGKGSKKVMQIWTDFMTYRPSKKEQEEFIAYYDSLEEPKTQRDIEIEQFKERQRRAIEDLERKSCGCEGETSNIESVEKVAGAVSTGAVAHSHLFKPRYGKKKKRCKKCRK